MQGDPSFCQSEPCAQQGRHRALKGKKGKKGKRRKPHFRDRHHCDSRAEDQGGGQ